MAVGNIDGISGGRIQGWLFAEGRFNCPYVTVNGQPARLLDVGMPRPDVEKALGVKGDFGFFAELPGSCSGTTTVMLHAVDVDGIRFVRKRSFDLSYSDGFSPLDLEAAIATAREPGSVAIVVWDAAHNPVGRAKVLYDIVTTRRPAVLFGFCHAEFGNRLWEPIQSTPIRSCLIRPEAFDRFRDEARAIGLSFDTIWMCKPRLPTFVLAEALAHRDTAFILDIDDNEDAFSRGEASIGRWYGEAGVNKAALFRDRTPVRSVASISLQTRFGGEIVRHARKPVAPLPQAAPAAPQQTPADAPSPKPVLRLVFIGTVRPHKGLQEAARAIRMVAYQRQVEISLTVGGTFDPPSLADELHAIGVETLPLVPSSDLVHTLAGYDAVLTAYPGHASFQDVNTYQISSKIGDALQTGLPVLVPHSPATADLGDIPGVYLFDAQTFASVIGRLIDEPREASVLPDSFTLEGAYKTFAALEAQARAIHPLQSPPRPAPAEGRNIVILWKQNDAGLYGRRVDQVARMLTSEIPDARVRVVEFGNPATLRIQNPRMIATSGERLCVPETHQKLAGVTREGVTYHTLIADNAPPAPGMERRGPGFGEVFEDFLHTHRIYASNSLLISFPLHFIDLVNDELMPIFRRFRTIVDIVDNQLTWAPLANWPNRIAHYRALCDLAHTVVFNSAINRDAMRQTSIVADDKVRLIPNWYVPPRASAPAGEIWVSERGNVPHVLYSGDLNNRIDWDLLDAVAALIGSRHGVLHIIGPCERQTPKLAHLLRRPQCVYHGAMREEAVLTIAELCDFAVMPHALTDHSTYMNPLKIKMYAAMGLPHVVTDVPGLDECALTVVAPDHDAFLDAVRTLLARPWSPRETPLVGALPADAARYRDLVADVLGVVEARQLPPRVATQNAGPRVG